MSFVVREDKVVTHPVAAGSGSQTYLQFIAWRRSGNTILVDLVCRRFSLVVVAVFNGFGEGRHRAASRSKQYLQNQLISIKMSQLYLTAARQHSARGIPILGDDLTVHLIANGDSRELKVQKRKGLKRTSQVYLWCHTGSADIVKCGDNKIRVGHRGCWHVEGARTGQENFASDTCELAFNCERDIFSECDIEPKFNYIQILSILV
ncbi:hypothetical protein EDD18DRAFT_1109616 [Armillaria luteobubalina]|uniref:Uncharacterized protein n=1 Tax=Armillaria luteobubalina TaxID=153913 RepID=A0AA39PUK9_9AGAR|nr:hypothetical protein EDD18DRAFT_1109616 [Armillaria luteobubalina]